MYDIKIIHLQREYHIKSLALALLLLRTHANRRNSHPCLVCCRSSQPIEMHMHSTRMLVGLGLLYIVRHAFMVSTFLRNRNKTRLLCKLCARRKRARVWRVCPEIFHTILSRQPRGGWFAFAPWWFSTRVSDSAQKPLARTCSSEYSTVWMACFCAVFDWWGGTFAQIYSISILNLFRLEQHDMRTHTRTHIYRIAAVEARERRTCNALL